MFDGVLNTLLIYALRLQSNNLVICILCYYFPKITYTKSTVAKINPSPDPFQPVSAYFKFYV